MKIAIAGLANSHPFTDAQHLTERHGAEIVVYDESRERVDEFLERFPHAEVAGDVAELLSARPDAAVVTVRPPEVNMFVRRFLDVDVPTYVSKPAAVTQAQLAELEELVVHQEQLFFTASVLRYASSLDALPRQRDLAAAHVEANHHIDYWHRPESRWQDDPEIGGGLIPMMGVHAFELLEVLLGPTMRITSCIATRLADTGLASPEIASGTAANAAGAMATFEINGMSEGQSYVVEYMCDDDHRTIKLGAGEDPFGFLTVADLVAAMADGQPSPIAWEDTHAVLRAIVDARHFAGM